MDSKLEKSPRQFVQEICGLTRESVSRVLNNPNLPDRHEVRKELRLYLQNSKKHVQTRRAIRGQNGQRI